LDAREIQELLRTRHNLRVGVHTAQYIAARLAAAKDARGLAVFAANARTGVPQPIDLKLGELSRPSSQMPLFQR
jgi:hypothetical protein